MKTDTDSGCVRQGHFKMRQKHLKGETQIREELDMDA